MRRKTDRRIKGAALAIRDDCALYAELFRDDDGYSVVNADTFELPEGLVRSDHIADPERLGAFLRKKCAFRWGKLPLALAVPSSDCIFRTFSLPAADAEEAKAAMRWTFSDYFPFQYDEALFDLCEIPETTSAELQLIGVACERKVVMPVLEALKNSRAQVQSVEPAIVAVARAFSHPEGTGTRLLVAGVGNVVHLVFFKDGEALFFHPLFLTPSDGASKIEEEINWATEYIAKSFHEAEVQICPAGNFPSPLFLAPEKTRSGTADDFHPLKFNPPADNGWFDVAGLLLRYGREDRI